MEEQWNKNEVSGGSDKSNQSVTRLTAKNHINQLYTKKARNDENSTTLATTLQSSISTASCGEQKYLFELLQNADDSSSKKEGLEITIHHVPIESSHYSSYLIFSHNGQHFTPTDVEKITDNAQQLHTDKSLHAKKTGYKGIGFKAIFSISDCVHILSGHYSFCFDKNYSKLQPTRGKVYPWQIIPIWTEWENIYENKVQEKLKPELVNFIIAVKQGVPIENDLLEILHRSEIILFLRNIKKLTIIVNGEKRTLELIRKKDNSVSIIKDNGTKSSVWVTHQQDILITQDKRDILLAMDDYQCPHRLKKAEKTSLTYAAKLEDEKKPKYFAIKK